MTARAEALLDSDVIVAIVAELHKHHASSAALLPDRSTRRFAVAAHSYADAFVTLTRRSAGASFRWAAKDAWATRQSIAQATTLVGLTPAQTFEAIGGCAADGGIGARVYGRLIGQVAIQYAIPRIITWNVGHLRGLFPALEVVDPTDASTPPR